MLLLVLLLLSAFVFWNFVWKRRGLPPGPVPLPLIGNGLTMRRSKCPYAPFQQWARKFGPIYTVWLGEEPVVVVTDFGLMRDMFVKDGDAYAGRHFFVELMPAFKASRGMLYGVMARKEGKEPGEANDLLNCFLAHMEANDRQEEERKKYFNIDNLRNVCFDLFFAGQETTSSTLNFFVLYLLLDQRVQTKMQAELDKLYTEKERNGVGGMVTMADRAKLPYLNAVVNECQRMCNLLPLNLTHRTMADVQIKGKNGKIRLSRGTTIVPQICCVLFDEKIFPKPHRFLPERFLKQNGELERFEEMIPFGLGKRICMGESLARMELFLFTANFFRHFQVLPGLCPLCEAGGDSRSARERAGVKRDGRARGASSRNMEG
uniref:Cytochrome P450 n=1 Tax=Globodera pallida TaxID=36090 RepID=A0A183CKA4_GLOPA